MKCLIFKVFAALVHFTRISGGDYRPPSQPPPPTSPGSPSSNTSTLALVTLGCGVLTWIAVPILAAMVGVVTGLVEYRRIQRGESPEAGRLINLIGLGSCAFQLISSFVCACGATLIYGLAWVGFILSFLGLGALSGGMGATP